MGQQKNRIRPELQQTIRLRIIKCRKARGLSLDQLAHLAGVTKQSIHMVEQGLQYPALGNLDYIARGLGVPMGYLLGEVDDEINLRHATNGLYPKR